MSKSSKKLKEKSMSDVGAAVKALAEIDKKSRDKKKKREEDASTGKRLKFSHMRLNVETDDRVLFFAFDSSNIDSMAYDIYGETLHVVFKSNMDVRYEYYMVPKAVFLKLVTSTSVGSSFSKLVKGKFEYKQEDNV